MMCLYKQSFQQIEYKEVTYQIEGKPILNHVNLLFEKNKKYAIIGPSGSGKSTLFKLLFGYDRDYSGEILLDQEERRKMTDADFYTNTGILQQNVYLFDDTIRNNITLYEEKHSDQEVIAAMKQAGLTDWLEKNQYRLDRMVGESGASLSGGEKQRMALVRLLLKNRDFLFLDELSTGLDNQIAAEIENTIISLENKTCVMITHHYNLAVLKKCDRIIIIENGQIKQIGNLNDSGIKRFVSA